MSAQIEQQLANIKSSIVGLQRERRSSAKPGLSILIRALTAKFKAHGTRIGSAEETARQLYGERAVTEAVADLPKFLARAAVSPASTSVSGWASELVGSENYSGLLPSLAPSSVYAQLSSRGLRLDFAGRGTIKIPGRSASTVAAGDFIGEGAAIPARRLSLSALEVGPVRKMAMLSYFSEELREQSSPSIEAILRQTIADDTANILDSKLLDNVAASSVRPAGLLNVAAWGTTTVTAVAGGGIAALSGDLGALAAAIPAANDLVYIMNDADRMRALTIAPGLLGVTILSAPYLAARTIVALDAADFVSGEGDAPRIDLSSQAVIHGEDTAPLPLVSGTAQPPTLAQIGTPQTSAFQQDQIVMRMIAHVVWAMRRSGRVAAVSSVTW